MIKLYITLFAIVLTACSSRPSLSEKAIPFTHSYAVTKNGKSVGKLWVHVVVTQKDNLPQVRSSLVFDQKQRFKFEEGSFLTTVVSYSNYNLFIEDIDGVPVFSRQHEIAVHTNTSQYLKLMRRRLSHLFQRYNGANAKGKERFVQEKLRVTRASVTASLPDSALTWRFADKYAFVSGRVKKESVSNRMPFSNLPVMLHGLRTVVYGLAKNKKKRQEILLFLPGVLEKPQKVLLALTQLSNKNYTLQFATENGVNNRVLFDSQFIPISVEHGTNLQIVRIPRKPKKKSPKKNK